MVGLYKNGKQETCLVHRLVAQTFIPNPNNLPQVNHKDENRQNNNVNNLEWCDAKYNNNYGNHNKKISESKKGEKNYFYGRTHSEETRRKMSENHTDSKLGNNPKAKAVVCDGKFFECLMECALFYDVNYNTIYGWITGRYNMPQKFKDMNLHWATKEELKELRGRE